MNYLFTLLGYGDNLITASLLEQASTEQREDVVVVGTELTRQVWGFMSKRSRPDIVLFDQIPAFYTPRTRGVLASWQDAGKLRAWVRETIRPPDTAIFERPTKLRNRWLLAGNDCNVAEVPRETTVYRDRAHTLAPFVGKHTWKLARTHVAGLCHSLLINPSARSPDRVLANNAIDKIINCAKNLGVKVVLLDTEGVLSRFQSRVDVLKRKPTMEESLNELRNASCYIGPDSFFVHLAYYYGIPQLSVFKRDNMYFCPPGLSHRSGVVYFDELDDVRAVETGVRYLCGAGEP